MLIVKKLDSLLGIKDFYSAPSVIVGIFILTIGFILRIRASFIFYQNNLKVISLRPQQTFVKSGPYKFSRNPLYLGIIGIILGLALLFGSPNGVIFSFLVFLSWDLYARLFEEKTLERKFGEDYLQYKQEVPRWIGFKYQLSNFED